MPARSPGRKGCIRMARGKGSWEGLAAREPLTLAKGAEVPDPSNRHVCQRGQHLWGSAADKATEKALLVET